jgi:hypothetical protein
MELRPPAHAIGFVLLRSPSARPQCSAPAKQHGRPTQQSRLLQALAVHALPFGAQLVLAAPTPLAGPHLHWNWARFTPSFRALSCAKLGAALVQEQLDNAERRQPLPQHWVRQGQATRADHLER